MARKIGENGMNISKSKLFWRTQRECWRRMVTPYVLYLFMSMSMLATQMIGKEELTWLRILLGVLCIAIGMFFNGHLAYNAGVQHYDAFLTGNLHRKNIEAGINSGGDHRLELEYAPWKGFYIGFLVGIPVILFTGLACIPGAMNEELVLGRFMLLMFAGFAIIPVSWVFEGAGGVPTGSYAWALLFVIVPIIITGVFYIVGAHVEKKRKKVLEVQKEAPKEKKPPKEYHEQTEEQKRKTQQSKKKKK